MLCCLWELAWREVWIGSGLLLPVPTWLRLQKLPAQVQLCMDQAFFHLTVGLYVPSVCWWFLNYYDHFWPPILSSLLNFIPWMSNWNFKLTRCKTTSLTYPTLNLFLPQDSPFQKSGPPSVCSSHWSHSWFPVFFTPYLLIHQPILLVLLLKYFPHLPTFLSLSCSLLHFH